MSSSSSSSSVKPSKKRKASEKLEKEKSPTQPDYTIPSFSEDGLKTAANPISCRLGVYSGGINYTSNLPKFQSLLAKALISPDVRADEFNDLQYSEVLFYFDKLIELTTRMYNLYYSWIWSSEYTNNADSLAQYLSLMMHLKTFPEILAKRGPKGIVGRLIDFYALYCPSCKCAYHAPHMNPMTDGNPLSFYKPAHLDPYRVLLGCGHIVCSGCAYDNLPASPPPSPQFFSTIAAGASEAVVRCPICPEKKNTDVIAMECSVATSPTDRCGNTRCTSHISFFTPLFRVYHGTRTENLMNICLPCVYALLKQRFIDDFYHSFSCIEKKHLPDVWASTNLTPAFRPYHRNIVFHAPHSYCVEYEWEGGNANSILLRIGALKIKAACTVDPIQRAALEKELGVLRVVSCILWSRCSGFCRRAIQPLHPVHPAWINQNKDCHHIFCAECVEAYKSIHRLAVSTETNFKSAISIQYWDTQRCHMACPRCQTPLDSLVPMAAEDMQSIPEPWIYTGFMNPVVKTSRRITIESMMAQLRTRDLAQMYTRPGWCYNLPHIKTLASSPMFQYYPKKPFPSGTGFMEEWFCYVFGQVMLKVQPALLEAAKQKIDLFHTEIVCSEDCDCKKTETDTKDKKKPQVPCCPICYNAYQSKSPAHHPYAFKECGHCICRQCVPKLVKQIDSAECEQDLRKIVTMFRTPALLQVKGTQCPVCRAGFSGMTKSVAMLSVLE